jgi:hypothetical protein
VAVKHTHPLTRYFVLIKMLLPPSAVGVCYTNYTDLIKRPPPTHTHTICRVGNILISSLIL